VRKNPEKGWWQAPCMHHEPFAEAMRPDVPVIMITAYGDDNTKRKAIENGAEGLLTKPIDFALLREQIDTRLGRAV
jgi:DNA-binding response OmpR family regulator